MRPRLLFLCHRVPYPPIKGEKIRAWHMLDHLADRWELDLGCLLDDPADAAHLPLLRGRCAAVECHPVAKGGRAARALLGLRPGRSLTQGWFANAPLARWVDAGLAEGRWQAAFVYSSAMAPYVMHPPSGAPAPWRVLDMVDVDSEKWRAYAAAGRSPMRPVWAREARTLLRLERAAAVAFDRTILVSRAERDRMAELAPEGADRLGWVDNGVALERFDPALPHANPYPDDTPAIAFTGTMDYRPNIDAVCWFADQVMPLLRGRARPPAFHIVGSNPAPAVRTLATRPDVHVTGPVPDVRPYLAHAAVVVAPLRIARGIQNKVLEAMAMARPVVASPQAFEGIHARPGTDLLVADGAVATAAAVAAVLDGAHARLGAAGRAAVAAGHDWTATLAGLDDALRRPAPVPATAPPQPALEPAA